MVLFFILLKELNLKSKSHFSGFNLSVIFFIQFGIPIPRFLFVLNFSPIKDGLTIGQSKIKDFISFLDNNEEFAKKVNEIYINKELAKKMGKNSKKMVEKYLLENVMESYVKIYEKK